MSKTELKQQVIEIPAFICLILTGFKLSGSIIAMNWSWWIVLSPLLVCVLYFAASGVLALVRMSKALDKVQNSQMKENAF